MSRLSRLLFVVMISIVLVMGMSQSVFAADSISDDPTKPHIVDDGGGGTTGGGQGSGGTQDVGRTVITEPDPGSYNNKDVGKVVQDVIDGKKVKPEQIVDRIPQKQGKRNPESFPTTDGLHVNLRLYDVIIPFSDIGINLGGTVSYKVGGNNSVSIQSRALMGLDASDVLVMVIDPDTGEIYLVSPNDLDPKTGKMNVTFPVFGPFCVLQKLPIIVRDVHTDEYLNEFVAESVDKVTHDDFVELKDWMNAFGIDGDTLEVADGVTVKADDYSSANIIADVAMRLSREDFSYNLNTKLRADLYQDLRDIDVQRIFDYADIDFSSDIEKLMAGDEAAKKELLDIDPFVLEDCFIYHVDAKTGDVSIAYEPTISFDDVENDGTNSNDKKVENRNKSLDENNMNVESKGSVRANIVDAEKFVKVGNIKEFAEKIENADVLEALGMTVHAADSKDGEKYKSGKDKDKKAKILTWDVPDIEPTQDEDELCIVMGSDKYLGMGPFLLFMPKHKSMGSVASWWWILLVIAAIVAGVVVYRKTRNGKKA